jgi:type I restriction enzyme S subunit
MKFERLGNIIKIAKGKKPTFVDSPTTNSIRVLQIDDLRNDNNIKYTNDKSGVFAKEDDVILAWDGANAGTIGFGKTGFIGSTLAVLRKNNPKDFDTVFIGKFLQTQLSFLRSKSTGATIPHINRNSLESLKIPCLSLPDQIKMANLLSKAETLIEQRKQSITLLDEFLKSSFLEMFGDPGLNKKNWEKKTMREVSKKFSDGPFGSNLKTSHYSETGVRVIRLQNIGVGEFLDDAVFVNQEHYNNVLYKYTCGAGDIVIATMGDPNVRACIIPKFIDKAINKADCVLCRVNEKIINSKYLVAMLNQRGFLFLASTFLHGQTRTRITMGQLSRIKIPVSPIELQTQFASIVTKTEVLKEEYKNSLIELENLYGSLSQKAFKGELEFSKHQTAAAVNR